jgi:hypothetical protein
MNSYSDTYLFTGMLADFAAETGRINKCNLDLQPIAYPVKKFNE